ncbi:MAG: export transporter periplasmic protein LptC [Pseudomonadota bacterium]|jgi:lipopolysaccharide export system protein LptC
MDVDSEPMPLAPLTAALGAREQADQADAAQPAWVRRRAQLAGLTPVLLMAVLAAATWWLVQHAPRPAQAAPLPALGHVADYEMRGFSIRHQGRSGLAASLIEGARVRHFADTDTLEVDSLRLHWRDADGRVTEAVADRAVVRTEGTELVLEGHARVHRAAALAEQSKGAAPGAAVEFRSEWIFIDTRKELVRTHQPVTLLFGGSRFEARGLRYDHHSEDLELDGPVRGQVTAGGR